MSHDKEFENISFDLPKNQSNVIKVIGVGGGGSNAINHMFQQGINGVDFVICNTDAQALQNSGVPNKIQLGLNLTEGLGAGANPEVGEQSAVESFDEIQQMLGTNTKMIFITAGMGGGTGTGAAPIIAKMAKDLDILTVAIVTMPFQFEGKMRNDQAQQGIENIRNVVDSLIVINNNKLREVYGNLGFKAGFSKADEVLSTAARGIAEVITHHYTQNIDLRDAKTVLSNSGTAIMGSAVASGDNRAQDAIKKALDSPLLNDNKIEGAKNVLLLIVSGSSEITIDEIGEINDHIQIEAGHGANIIMGVGEDENLKDSIAVTIIATGFNLDQQDEISNTETKKVVHSLEEEQGLKAKKSGDSQNVESIFVPKEEVDSTVVKHVLCENEILNEEMLVESAKVNEMDLIPTSEALKNIDVVYEDILAEAEQITTDDFVIKSITEEEEVNEVEADSDEQQVILTFDLPLSSNENAGISEVQAETESQEQEEEVITHSLSEDDIKNIEVIDAIEVESESNDNNNEEGEKVRHVLEEDEFIEVESSINETTKEQDLVAEDEILFEKKVVDPEVVSPTPAIDEVGPMNTPISDLLKERAEERRRKMKDFNHKFNNAKIDDIEKVPAYKRQGVDLDEVDHSSSETNISRTSIDTDDNDDIQLRTNNSFLHDNVD